MSSAIKEYRYRARARQRALLWLSLSALLFVGLCAVLIGRWAELNLAAKVLGGVLVLVLGATLRGQLGRYAFRCRVGPEVLEVSAPLNHRRIGWQEVEEVRRMALPHVGSGQRWACTLRLRSPTRSTVPTFIFDDQLEDAEEALRRIAQHTPRARHVGIESRSSLA